MERWTVFIFESLILPNRTAVRQAWFGKNQNAKRRYPNRKRSTLAERTHQLSRREGWYQVTLERADITLQMADSTLERADANLLRTDTTLDSLISP